MPLKSKMKVYQFSSDPISSDKFEDIVEKINKDAIELGGFVAQFEIINKNDRGGKIVVNFQYNVYV